MKQPYKHCSSKITKLANLIARLGTERINSTWLLSAKLSAGEGLAIARNTFFLFLLYYISNGNFILNWLVHVFFHVASRLEGEQVQGYKRCRWLASTMATVRNTTLIIMREFATKLVCFWRAMYCYITYEKATMRYIFSLAKLFL